MTGDFLRLSKRAIIPWADRFRWFSDHFNALNQIFARLVSVHNSNQGNQIARNLRYMILEYSLRTRAGWLRGNQQSILALRVQARIRHSLPVSWCRLSLWCSWNLNFFRRWNEIRKTRTCCRRKYSYTGSTGRNVVFSVRVSRRRCSDDWAWGDKGISCASCLLCSDFQSDRTGKLLLSIFPTGCRRCLQCFSWNTDISKTLNGRWLSLVSSAYRFLVHQQNFHARSTLVAQLFDVEPDGCCQIHFFYCWWFSK